MGKFKTLIPDWNFSTDSEPNEIWVDLKGYVGTYQISSLGRMKTFNWRAQGKIMIVTPKVHQDGYLFYALTKDKKRTSQSAHRIVANNFLEKINGRNEVNHIDGIKTNDKIENLEWVTHQENMHHASVMKLWGKSKSKAA